MILHLLLCLVISYFFVFCTYTSKHYFCIFLENKMSPINAITTSQVGLILIMAPDTDNERHNDGHSTVPMRIQWLLSYL